MKWPLRISGYGAVPADVGLQAQAGRGTGGGDAERAFAVRRTAAFVQGRVGPDAVDVFRFGDFAGWLIEGKKSIW